MQPTDVPVLLTPEHDGLLAKVVVWTGSLDQYEGIMTISWPVDGIGSSGVRVRVMGE